MIMQVEMIKYPTEEDWLLVKQCTLVTVGKESEKPPTDEFKRKILRARHSPIRELKFVFRLTGIPYWVSVHLCRHIHAQPYVKSQRNDRQSEYKKNYIYLNDYTLYVVEDITGTHTDPYHYKIYFHTEILPDVEVKP